MTNVNTYPPETTDGVVTSWIPLTAIFTPSKGCESKFRLDGPSLMAYDPGYGLDIDSKVKCAPPAVTTWWEQGRLGGGDDAGHTAASLGPLSCPNAWTTVASYVRASSTQIMCCPPYYYLADGISGTVAGDCLSDVTKGAVLTFASTSDGSSDAWTTATTTLTDSSTVGAIGVVGWNIALKATSAAFTTSSASSTFSTTSSATPASTSSVASTSTISSTSTTAALAAAASTTGSSASSGLPTGATIGIGLGVALGVIGIGAVIATMYLIRSRKKKAAAAAAGAAAGMPPGDNGGSPPPPAKPAEAYHYATHELSGQQVVQHELPVPRHSYRPFELA